MRIRTPRTLCDYFSKRGADVISEPDAAAALTRAKTPNHSHGIDIAVFVPGQDNDDLHLAARLRDLSIVPLLYGASISARTRLRYGFSAAIPVADGDAQLDCNILFLMSHDRARDRKISQQAALEAAISLDIRGKRVLVLEDRLVNQIVIRKQLQKLGIISALAVDGVCGLEILEDQEFDLILCDCSMPVMDGYQFTSALRKREVLEHLTRTPVIALTANAFREDVDRSLASGMDDFISKPVTMGRLAAVLVKWLKPTDGRADETARKPSENQAATPVIDLAVLADIMGGDAPETLNEVLAAFLATASGALEQVEAAVSSGDIKRIRATTHGAKGDARNAAATRLADLYAELERRTKDGDHAASRDLVVRARAEVGRVETFIEKHLGASAA